MLSISILLKQHYLFWHLEAVTPTKVFDAFIFQYDTLDFQCIYQRQNVYLCAAFSLIWIKSSNVLLLNPNKGISVWFFEEIKKGLWNLTCIFNCICICFWKADVAAVNLSYEICLVIFLYLLIFEEMNRCFWMHCYDMSYESCVVFVFVFALFVLVFHL